MRSCHALPRAKICDDGGVPQNQEIFGLGEANQVTLTSTDFDLFVARYTSAGAFVSAKMVPGANPDLRALAALPDGGFALAGRFQTSGNTITFDAGGPGAITLGRLAQYTNEFVAWYRADGSCRLARMIITSHGFTSMNGMIARPDGALIVAGCSSGQFTFGPQDLVTATFTKTGGGYENVVGEDMFLAGLRP